MARVGLLFLSLFICSCIGAGIGIFEENTNICLYSGDLTKTLRPLQIRNNNCPGQTTNCMNAIYKYSNWQYNGVASLKPARGEVFSYLSQDQQGKIDLVVIMNANVQITSKVFVEITGAEPTPILLYDDPSPSDTWVWANNRGNFSWATQPGYTDGVIIGHIKFTDNYCVRMSFQQTAGALNKVSILSGNITHVQKVHSVPYVSGQTFEYCQYPVTGQVQKDATCPGATDGSASIWIIFGPSNVEYTWFSSTGVLISSGPNATNLAAGSYRVFVTDPSTDGCSIDRTITIRDHVLTGAPVTTTAFACITKGSASVAPAGGSGGFSYEWFRAGQAQPFQTGAASTVTGLDQGNYYVIATDSCGSKITTNFVISTTGCCGDGICQNTATRNETCSSANYCAQDCGVCCAPGTYINQGACTVCPPGSRSTIYQAASCSNCPANTYNAGGSDACSDCPANTYSAIGSGKCSPCPLGQVRDTDASSCSECAAGTHAPACGSSGCTDCAAGTFSEAGAHTCKTCPAGTYSAAKSAGCTTCSDNTYSIAKSSKCTACPSGTSTVAVGTHLLSCN